MIAWSTVNTGQPLPPGLSYRGNSGNSGSYYHLNTGSYQSFHLYPQTFAPWEVALTVILAAVLVATVVVFLRRLGRA
jgi:hypothetical protein